MADGWAYTAVDNTVDLSTYVASQGHRILFETFRRLLRGARGTSTPCATASLHVEPKYTHACVLQDEDEEDIAGLMRQMDANLQSLAATEAMFANAQPWNQAGSGEEEGV